jgi:hypothetical protein
MEGIFFYWTFWVLWICMTFFVSKYNPNRVKYSVIILLSIILSSQYIQAWGLEVSVVSLLFLLIAYYEVGKMKGKSMAYFLITSFILMLAYGSFQLFELFDPVWLILDRNWMFAVVLTYMTIMMHNQHTQRIMVLIFGSIHGEIIYSLVLDVYSMKVPIGTLRFLDVISISVCLILAWSGFEKLASLFEGHVYQLEKGRGKQS